MSCQHEWITVSECSHLVGDDIEITKCAQCGTYQVDDEPVFDDSDFDYDEWLRNA
jgi:hypothetical protein